MNDQYSTWMKSSYSSGEQSNCVEVAKAADAVGVRDTKDRAQGHLDVPAPSWTALLGQLQ